MQPTHEEPLAAKSLSVRVSVELDAWVRSLPNRTEWLRKAIADAYEKEIESQQTK